MEQYEAQQQIEKEAHGLVQKGLCRNVGEATQLVIEGMKRTSPEVVRAYLGIPEPKERAYVDPKEALIEAMSAGDNLTKRAQEKMAQNPELTFTQAFEEVCKADPETFKTYRGA
jgi:hypothetical protein